MLHLMKLHRVATREGCLVHWQNAVGPALGQGGTYHFASEDEAQRFAEYAESDGAPSLHENDLREGGIPLPVKREGKWEDR